MDSVLAEAIGTMMLVLLGDGVVANVVLTRSKGQNSGWIVITLGLGRGGDDGGLRGRPHQRGASESGRDVGLATIGSFPWADVPGYIAAQLVGAFAGAVLVWLAYLPHWAVTADAEASKLAVFATGPAIRHPGANLITEIIGTAVLLFGILAIAANAQALARPGDVDLSRRLQPRTAAASRRHPGPRASASRWAAPPATRSTRRATSGRASRTRVLPIPGQGRFRLGLRLDSRSSARSSADVRRRGARFGRSAGSPSSQADLYLTSNPGM